MKPDIDSHKLELRDYIEFGSEKYRQSVDRNSGGVYLISTEMFYKRGIAKIGIASNFHKRFHSFKSCYAWFTEFYIFGLIPFPDRKDSLKEERRLLTRFAGLRLHYPYTENATEWIILDIDKIREVFSEHPNAITSFSTLIRSPPIIDVDNIKILETTSSGGVQVEFPDGSKGVQPRNTVSNIWADSEPEDLRKTNPLLISSQTGMTQARYNELWRAVKNLYTKAEIRQRGGTSAIAQRLAQREISEYQRRQREKRSRKVIDVDSE